MMTPLEKFKKDYQGKRVLIMGLGLLGRGVGDAEFFVKIGAQVTVTDLRSASELKPSLHKLQHLPIKFVLGKHRNEDIINSDVIIRNAAVSEDSPYLKLAGIKNIPIEMDEALFVKYAPVKIIGITGTRGKSTTTMLIYEIIKAAKFNVHLGGNIKDKATLPLLTTIKKDDWVVLELSSWQLQGFTKIKISPHIAVFTNIYEDHLNRYPNMKSYIKDKEIIYKYQNKNDFLVINKSLVDSAILEKEIKSKKIIFSSRDFPFNMEGKIKLIGGHNKENIAAAISVAKLLKIDEKIYLSVIRNFKGLSYRLELVATIAGINYINDTTSTTPIAAIKAINTFPKPILIAGGSSKNLDMKEFAKTIAKSVKAVALLNGSATKDLYNLIIQSNGKSLVIGIFNNFAKAIAAVSKISHQGDTVLFSPGCASFGMFKNEFDRGDQFNELVFRLK